MREHWRCWVIPLTIVLSLLLLWLPLGGYDKKAHFVHADMATLTFSSMQVPDTSATAPAVEDTWEPVEVTEPAINPIIDEAVTLPVPQEMPTMPETGAVPPPDVTEPSIQHPDNPSLPSTPASPSSGNTLATGYAEVDGDTIAPRYTNFKLQYPAMARRRNIEGTVLVEVYVSDTGNIDNVQVLDDPGNGFGEAVREAFRHAKASPATRGGKAIAVVQRIPIRFSLR